MSGDEQALVTRGMVLDAGGGAGQARSVRGAPARGSGRRFGFFKRSLTLLGSRKERPLPSTFRHHREETCNATRMRGEGEG